MIKLLCKQIWKKKWSLLLISWRNLLKEKKETKKQKMFMLFLSLVIMTKKELMNFYPKLEFNIIFHIIEKLKNWLQKELIDQKTKLPLIHNRHLLRRNKKVLFY
jgi:hypothetical protein